MTSTNGVRWETHLRFENGSAFGIWMKSIAYGNGVFVASEPYQGTWASTNGVDWEFSPFPMVNAVAFCDGVFHTGIAISTNGVDWIDTSAPIGSVNAIACGNGATVMVGDRGNLLVTTNRLDWLAPVTGIAHNLMCVAFDGQQFVVSGWLGVLFTSTNGLDWVDRSVSDNNYFLAAASYGGRTALAGFAYATLRGADFEQTYPNDQTGVNAMTVAGGEFWAVGDGGLILRSTDGLYWTDVTERLPIAPARSLYDVAFDGKKFLAIGDRYVYGSTDGTKWDSVPAPSELAFSGIAWGNGRFVIVGADIAHPLGQPISSSVDGTNWVSHSISNDDDASFGRVFFINNRFVALGWGGRVATSVEGTNWTMKSLGSQFSLSAATYGEGRYWIGGANYSDSGNRHSVLFSSKDLGNWTSNSVSIAEDFWDMTYGRGVFLAGYIRSGWPEGLMWSRDGVHWTSLPGHAERVVYRNGAFLAAGVNNIATSFNGRDFRQRNRMANQVPNGIAFGRGTYVIVGTHGMILQSGQVPPAFVLGMERDNPELGPILNLDSPFDGAYEVQSSIDGNTWNTFTTVQSTNGRFTIRDTNSLSAGMKVYRAVLP